jgi:methylated-DNA-[protein]-cysteine S-methyltransferase
MLCDVIQNIFYQTYLSPVGTLHLYANDSALLYVGFTQKYPVINHRNTPLFREAARQFDEYFDGKRTAFNLPFQMAGTPFQQKVWQALQTIPYGETRTYGQIAAQIGLPKAARAVGLANNRNPISIIVPCHRVIGSNGKLVGYAGGLPVKAELLSLETGR